MMPAIGNQVFLSPAMSDVIRQFRAAYPNLFAFAGRLNEFAHNEMFQTTISSTHAQQLLVASLLHRALTTYQGVVLLSERGMPSEARVLLRTLLEVVFRLVAIAKDPEVGRAYIAEDDLHRKKFINKFKLLSEERRTAAGNPALDSLLATLQEKIKDNDARELKTQWFAERAGLIEFYHTAYSVFSGTVHVNVRDLEKALVVDAQGDVTGFNYGPSDESLDATMLTAIESLIFCLRAAFSLLPISSDTKLDSMHKDFATLYDEVSKQQKSEA